MSTTTPPPTPETDAAIIAAKGTWTFELKEAMQRLERERDEARGELEAMREAIEDVNKILLSIQLNDIFEETMRNHATYALAKLQPFIEP